MQRLSTLTDLREFTRVQRHSGATVGFVPTMGALHAGHQSLIDRSVRERDCTVVSVFVNPLQFGPNEDLTKYPRPIEHDLALAMAAGAAAVFTPSVDEMYPDGSLGTSVRVDDLGDRLEGAVRPGHFEGVSTVVAKLLSLVGTCYAYFGEKDWQQLAIVRQMVIDLSLDATIIGCPTVREGDGLALSSRNVYLSKDERRAATALSEALRMGAASDHPELAMRERIASEPLIELEYAMAIDASLRPVSSMTKAGRLIIAVRIGTTRLIDNCGLEGP